MNPILLSCLLLSSSSPFATAACLLRAPVCLHLRPPLCCCPPPPLLPLLRCTPTTTTTTLAASATAALAVAAAATLAPPPPPPPSSSCCYTSSEKGNFLLLIWVGLSCLQAKVEIVVTEGDQLAAVVSLVNETRAAALVVRLHDQFCLYSFVSSSVICGIFPLQFIWVSGIWIAIARLCFQLPKIRYQIFPTCSWRKSKRRKGRDLD